MNKPIYIEFFGLAGSGKSTTCQCLKDELLSRGYSVYFLQDIIEYYSKHKLAVLLLVIYETVINGFKGLTNYYLICKDVGGLKKMYFAAYKNYILARRTVRIMRVDYILSDQCIIQNYISCYYVKVINNSKTILALCNNINIEFDKSMFICMDIDTKIAVDRIISRNTNYGRVDNLDKTSMYSVLKLLNHNISFIRENSKEINMVSIDASMTIENSINTIISQLKEKMFDKSILL